MRNKCVISALLCLLCVANASAWEWWPLPMDGADNRQDTLLYTVGLQGAASYGQTAPYWLQTNRHGDVSAAPLSGNITAGIIKPATRPNRWFDYDFALTLTGRLQSGSEAIQPSQNRLGNLYSTLAYAHLRLYIIDITAGIQPEQYGPTDNLLTSGGLLYSYNARPMPGVKIGIDQWTAFPGLFGYVEVRGGIAHMWQTDNVYVTQGMVHHKWVGGRIGGRLPVNVSYEFHHVAQWGGYSPVYGDLGNSWQAFMNAVLVRSGGTMANDQINAQGNHIGSQILTVDAKGDGWKMSAYWQNIFEDGPIRFIGAGMNAADGIWGLHISQNKWPYISGLTYEFINTTDQSGPYHDKDGYIYGGADSYFRNGIYRNGWNYGYRTIGTPFITSPIYNADGTIDTRNSRVQAHYIGLKGDICGYKYRAVCSYAKNYGNDNRSKTLLSTNTGVLLEVERHVEKAWGLDFGLSLAADFGTQFGNQFGAMIRISKQGLITQLR
ncbi:MAG: capsule assembly Wzi family protein [Paludibacteraceae bacterium]|nr:capsule assembly Wzi family protein [Paludibacteraceae bacterium]